MVEIPERLGEIPKETSANLQETSQDKFKEELRKKWPEEFCQKLRRNPRFSGRNLRKNSG